MKNIIKITLLCITLLGSIVLGYNLRPFMDKSPAIQINTKSKDKLFEAYYIENLNRTVAGSFKITKELAKETNYVSSLFEFEFQPNPSLAEKKKTTGIINIPNQSPNSPLVLMIRGYVDQKIYTSGMGSKRAAEFFAQNGYITVAPDFLGYAESSPESTNIFETRFQTYTTVISLYKSLKQIPQWDGKNVFIWAHSNGGQIALTLISAENLFIPTVLWAPVTKPFPYSVLYYTDESNDGGKLIRRELSKLEENYDVDKYSFTSYLERIKNPIQLHQGTSDDAVPSAWSKNFVNKLRSNGNDIDYFEYVDDHNLSNNWKTVIEKSLDFYNNNLIK